MSFLDRIKGPSGRPHDHGDSGVNTSRFDDIALADNPMEATVRLPGASQARHDAGPETFDQDVGRVDQRDGLGDLSLVLEVEHDALLVAVDGHERQALASREGRQGAAQIAAG
jgi:hypothetical protein